MNSYPKRFDSEDTPPAIVSVERAILGSSFIVKGAIDVVIEKTNDDDYFSTANRQVFNLIKLMVENNEHVDIITACAKAEEIGKPELMEIIQDLAGEIVSIETIEENYIPTLIEKSVERKLYYLPNEIKSSLKNIDNHEERLDAIDKAYYDARYLRAPSKIVSAREMVIETVDDMYKRHSGKLCGYKTGFVALDKIIGEFQPEDLIILAGRPSQGKTSLAISIMLNMMSTGVKVGFLSIEMSKKQICYRMSSMLTGVLLFKIIHGMVPRNELPEIQRSFSKIAEFPFDIEDSSGLTGIRAKSIIRQMVRRGANIIFVDHLHEMDYGDDPNTGIGKICAIFKGVAKEFCIPVVVLSQLSRGDKKSKDKRPGLSDLRHSGDIEQKADLVIFVHREEVYDKDNDSVKGEAELVVAKQRNGPTETAVVRFNHSTTRFYEESGF